MFWIKAKNLNYIKTDWHSFEFFSIKKSHFQPFASFYFHLFSLIIFFHIFSYFFRMIKKWNGLWKWAIWFNFSSQFMYISCIFIVMKPKRMEEEKIQQEEVEKIVATSQPPDNYLRYRRKNEGVSSFHFPFYLNIYKNL